MRVPGMPRVFLGDVLVLILIALPVALATPRLAVVAPADPVTAVVRVTGILALAMALVSGALSVRLPGLDRAFGGLTRLWQLHHLLGFGALVLTLAHVIALALGALAISRRLPVQTLFPAAAAIEVWLGWAALIGMLIFLAPSFKFFGEPHYQRWKWVHLTVAPATLLLALVHGFRLSPDAASWWALGALAIGSVAWRRVGTLLAGRVAYTVASVTPLADDVVEIGFEAAGRPLQHRPGQFVYLTPMDPALTAGRGEEHPFTISSAPGDPVLRMGVKALGDASRALLRIAPGTRAWIEGPYGDFFERIEPRRYELWLGGGIGITPFVGGLRARARDEGRGAGHVHLFYLAANEARAYYLDELRRAGDGMESVVITPHYFEQSGPIATDFLAAHCPDFAEREIYVCGSPPMLAHLRALLRAHGIPEHRIHSEEFTLL
jgi:predicted ferric reductase